MSPHRYYTLIASLPALPYFKTAERLPINRQRLDERLRMLDEKDASILAQARSVVEWGAHAADQTDAEFIRNYDAFLSSCESPSLRSVVLFRIDLRTIIAALRRRRHGEENGPATPSWGAGSWAAHIERNWRVADFKLGHRHPWIPLAHQHLENGESAALEELLMDLVWQNLSRSAFGFEFQLEAVIAFVFKWDILERWLSYNSGAARSRFSELGAELLSPPPLATA